MSELWLTFKGKRLEVSDGQHNRYSQTFPHVELLSEYLIMDLWLEAHPKRRGTHRFCMNWLAGEQRKAIERRKEAMVGANPFTNVRVKPEALTRIRERDNGKV
jgi:hypothetical protein